MEQITEKVPINICGRELKVAIEGLNPLEVSTIARNVEAKINDIKENSNIADTGKLGLLAALEFAAEVYMLQSQISNTRQADERKVDTMITSLRSALGKH